MYSSSALSKLTPVLAVGILAAVFVGWSAVLAVFIVG
jgi:hypothetical protein